MITAIFTDRKTTLTIESTEAINIEQLGHTTPVARLAPGANEVIVEAGVFRVLSKNALRVSAGTPSLYVASTLNTKDGNFPDPPRQSVAAAQLREFFVDGRSLDAATDHALT